MQLDATFLYSSVKRRREEGRGGMGRVQGQSLGRNEILLAPHFIATITLPLHWADRKKEGGAKGKPGRC